MQKLDPLAMVGRQPWESMGMANAMTEAILVFALHNDMVICNTLFQQK